MKNAVMPLIADFLPGCSCVRTVRRCHIGRQIRPQRSLNIPARYGTLAGSRGCPSLEGKGEAMRKTLMALAAVALAVSAVAVPPRPMPSAASTIRRATTMPPATTRATTMAHRLLWPIPPAPATGSVSVSGTDLAGACAASGSAANTVHLH